MPPNAPSSAVRFERVSWRPAPGAGSRCVIAATAAFLLFSPYLANLSRDYTRLCYFWTLRDSVEVILMVGGTGLLLAAVGEIVQGTGIRWMIRLHHLLLMVLLGTGLMANVVFAGQKVPRLSWLVSIVQGGIGWIVLAALVLYAAISPHSRLIDRIGVVCRIVLPVVPITFAGLLWQTTYPEPLEPLSRPPQAAAAQLTGGTPPGGGIYVFLFDEWSYEWTFDRGRVLDDYPNLAAFAASASVYHDAHSPGPNTEQSIPAMLYQTDLPTEIHRGRFGFDRRGRFVEVSELQSLFERFSPRGYHGAVVGFGLPYRLWLGDGIDRCRSYCYYVHGSGWASRLAQHLTNAWYYSPETWTSRLRKLREKRTVHGLISSIINDTRDDVHTIIRDWPERTFLFAHVHLPHPPAVVLPNLELRAASQTIWADGSVAGYRNNLSAMDALIGEFVEALRTAGKLDDSVVVLTADHNWRSDPDLTKEDRKLQLTHVPLLVKAPGQTEHRAIDERFDMHRLGELVESIVRP